MARSQNILLRNVQGQIGKELVIKQYKGKTIITAYPKIKKRKKLTELQKLRRGRFAGAVAYAKAIICNPTKKAAYSRKVKNGQTVYHYAIREFLAKEIS